MCVKSESCCGLIFLLLMAFACQQQPEATQSAFTFPLAEAEAIVAQIQSPTIPNRVIDLRKFAGLDPDEAGTHDFAPFISAAIDSLSAQGGGVLYLTHTLLPSAWLKQLLTYRVRGPIELKSNIELRIDNNVRLFFEFAPEAYLTDGKGVLRRYEGTTLYSYSPLIRAFNAENIAITGAMGAGSLGIIDGDGWKWQKWSASGDIRVQEQGKTPAYKQLRIDLNEADMPIGERICNDSSYHFLRPTMMEFFHCQKIRVEGLKLVSSPFWLVHPVFSQHITVRNLMFDAQVINNDGVDIESSQYALIENVIFDNHDDNVVIKAGVNREGREGALVAGSELEGLESHYIKNGRITAPTEKVVTRDCVFKGHYAFCIGSEQSGGARDLYLYDCVAPMEVKMGVFLKSSRIRGGTVENVYVDNLKLNYVENDVICLIPNYNNDLESPYPPTYRNIHISNVTAKVAGRGIRVFGWADQPISDVHFSNVQIDSVISNQESEIFTVNQAKNIQLKNVSIEGKSRDGTYEKVEEGVAPPRQG